MSEDLNMDNENERYRDLEERENCLDLRSRSFDCLVAEACLLLREFFKQISPTRQRAGSSHLFVESGGLL